MPDSVYVLIFSDYDYWHIESIWTTEEAAKAAHKRLHPRSKLDEPRCYDHEIEEWWMDSDEPIGRRSLVNLET